MEKFRVGFKSLLQFGKKCRKELTEQVRDCYPLKSLLIRLVFGW